MHFANPHSKNTYNWGIYIKNRLFKLQTIRLILFSTKSWLKRILIPQITNSHQNLCLLTVHNILRNVTLEIEYSSISNVLWSVLNTAINHTAQDNLLYFLLPYWLLTFIATTWNWINMMPKVPLDCTLRINTSYEKVSFLFIDLKKNTIVFMHFHGAMMIKTCLLDEIIFW